MGIVDLQGDRFNKSMEEGAVAVGGQTHSGVAGEVPSRPGEPARQREETLADRAYRLIEHDIVRLALPPGSRITEQELVDRVALGRTPVREAVQRLVSDGLLIVFPRKGMAVAALEPLQVLLAMEARLPLEQLVAAAAAKRRSDVDQEELVLIGRSMADAAEKERHDLYMQFDRALDEQLGRMSGNPYAARALHPLQSMARRAWFAYRREIDMVKAAACHVDVVEAVGRHDPDAAAAAVGGLVSHVRNGLREAILAT